MSGSYQGGAAQRRLRVRAIVISLLLVVQFFLGMITNLYVTIPDSHPGANAQNYFSGAASSVAWAISSGPSAWLPMHAALGLLLVLGSLEFIVFAARSRNKIWLWSSIAGASFIIGAGFNGASFLVFGKDYSSLIMAGLFGFSLCSYMLGMYLDARQCSYTASASGLASSPAAGPSR